MKIKLLILSLFLSFSALAQNQKIIKGYVRDGSAAQEPLAYATIMQKGTENGANTDENGYFELEVPDTGCVLEASFMGYQPQDITLLSDTTEELAFVLFAEDAELDQMVITVSQNKAHEAVLLSQQRKSLEIKQQIGAQELSRKGVSDVAGAVAKTTGVNKQESTGSIFVRGLGDRYNSTTLNGLPLVSNNPDTKNIDLDLFSTDIVEYISIDKTYLARMSGDFGGANVDILSKNNNSSKGFFGLQMGASVNSNAVSASPFYLQSGRNALGFSTNKATTSLTQHQFSTPFNTSTTTVPYGSALNLNAGKSFQIGTEGQLNLFATLGFNNDFMYREGINKTLNAQGVRSKDLQQQTYSYDTNTTGMFNAAYKINTNNDVAYNFLFVNGSSLSNDTYSGYMVDKAESTKGGIIQRNTYNQNQLMVHQLLGKHLFNEQTSFLWGASYNKIKSDMPDRTQTTLGWNEDQGQYLIVKQARSDNHRYFQDLTEEETAANAALDYKFSANEEGQYLGKITLGYAGRFKNRQFNALQFNYQVNGSFAAQPNTLDAFFNQTNLDAGLFQIVTFRGNGTNAFEPQYYNGDSKIHAGFATFEYEWSSRLFSVIGLRYEKINQKVDWKTQLDDTPSENQLNKNAFLPSLNVKYELTGNQNLRLAASKTYTLPQFKERARFLYEDVDQVIFGNPYLYASDNYNVDLKWELFPQNDELLSVTAFGKYIKNPINLSNIASSSNDITYINTGKYGYAAGVELEVRKNILYFKDSPDHKLSFGFNFAYMKTDQKLDKEKVSRENPGITANFTHETAGFTGASTFLGNADLSYSNTWKDKSILATLAYNYNSDRIYALGNEQKGNLVDKGFGMLDFVFKAQWNKNFGIGLSAKNLLDPKIERMQENLDQDYLVRSYKLGRNFGLTINYNF